MTQACTRRRDQRFSWVTFGYYPAGINGRSVDDTTSSRECRRFTERLWFSNGHPVVTLSVRRQRKERLVPSEMPMPRSFKSLVKRAFGKGACNRLNRLRVRPNVEQLED